MRQLFAVSFHTYSRPIPSPVQNLRPARDTCEQCHWPEKFHGDVIRRVPEYADDEKNTETVTTLQMHVGGGNERLGIATGIHWHMNVANEIEYIATDEKRQVIPYVRLKDREEPFLRAGGDADFVRIVSEFFAQREMTRVRRVMPRRRRRAPRHLAKRFVGLDVRLADAEVRGERRG